jgi:hypothetical protein
MLSYTREFSCQEESTLSFALILWVFCAIAVDKIVEIVWIKMWIIQQGI